MIEVYRRAESENAKTIRAVLVETGTHRTT
jgi:hypothetical protein